MAGIKSCAEKDLNLMARSKFCAQKDLSLMAILVESLTQEQKIQTSWVLHWIEPWLIWTN